MVTEEETPDTGDIVYGDYTYNTDGKGAYIVKYNGSASSVTIPSSLGGKTVYRIAAGAFKDNMTLRSITVPSSVYQIGTKYGNGAFQNCINLQTVTMKTGSTETGIIYESAFQGCKSLGSIVIPSNYQEIGEKAFYDCSYLSSVTLPSELREIGPMAFKNTVITKIDIPGKTEIIDDGAFQNCKKLTRAVIPASVSRIGSKYDAGVFEDCAALSTVTIKAGIATSTMGDNTFKNCWRLGEIVIPGNYVDIGCDAFNGCKSLTKMTLAKNASGEKQYIRGSAFNNCVSLNYISLPTTLYSIEDDAFRGSVITSVVVPEGVEKIETGAFADCSVLKKVSLPKSLATIGERYDTGAFENCPELTTVTIAAGGTNMVYMGASTFKNDAKLTAVDIPGNYEKIDVDAFYGCTALKSMKWAGSGYVYPNQIIGASAFYKCPNLASISLPNTLKSIGENAFNGCKATKMIVPDMVQTIGYGAFANCKYLHTVTLPSGLTKLGGSYEAGAFENCTSLVNLTIKEGDEQAYLYDNTFKGCTNLKSVIFPANYADLGRSTFANCTNLKVVYIEDSGVIFENQKLRDNMFTKCTSLKYMYVPKSVGSISNEFGYKDKVVFYGVRGSYAETYAKAQGIPFNATYGSKPVVSEIKLSKTTATTCIGRSITLKATVTPDYTPYQNVTWTSSNTNVAKVDYKGKVTGVSKGTATITCTSTDGRKIKKTCKVTVTDFVAVTGITLSKTSAEITKGNKLTLKTTIAPSNASDKSVTWTSSNANVATVSSTGVVTGCTSGTAIITCTAKDGSGKKATCKVTVYTNTEAFVARIYTKALGREPEAAGLKYWTNEINAKRKTPVQVAELFFFSAEFTNKKLTNTEYVKVLYRTFMGREADQAGLNYWVGRLNKGESRKTVLESFASCEEFKKIVKSFGL